METRYKRTVSNVGGCIPREEASCHDKLVWNISYIIRTGFYHHLKLPGNRNVGHLPMNDGKLANIGMDGIIISFKFDETRSFVVLVGEVGDLEDLPSYLMRA
jgi:hypothetical protein